MTNLQPDSITTDGLMEAYPVLRANSFGPWTANNVTSERTFLRKVVPLIFVAKLIVLASLLGLAGFAVLVTHALLRFIVQGCLAAVLPPAPELLPQCLHRTSTAP